MINKVRILDAGDHPFSHNDMRLQELHGDKRQGFVVMVNFGHHAGSVLLLLGERQILEMRAMQR